MKLQSIIVKLHLTKGQTNFPKSLL